EGDRRRFSTCGRFRASYQAPFPRRWSQRSRRSRLHRAGRLAASPGAAVADGQSEPDHEIDSAAASLELVSSSFVPLLWWRSRHSPASSKSARPPVSWLADIDQGRGTFGLVASSVTLIDERTRQPKLR